MKISPIIKAAGLALGFLLAASTALAQGFPNKPIRLVVPFPAGSATDLAARVVGQNLSTVDTQIEPSICSVLRLRALCL